MRQVLTTLTLLALVLAAHPASAQTLDMDMSWALQNQMQYQAMADSYAQAAAQEWLRQVWAYRMATGYTGPIQAPVSQQSLQNSIQGWNQAFDSYVDSVQNNSAAMDQAAFNYSNHAILNQGGYLNPSTGETYTLPDFYPHWWQYPDGTLVPTQTWDPPTYDPAWSHMDPIW